MKRASISLALAGLAAIGLAACTEPGGSTLITREWQAETYHPGIVRYPAAKGGLYTEVVPGRLAERESRFTERTVSILQNSKAGRSVTLTSDPAAGKASSSRLVVLFDPAVAIGANDVCRGSRRQSTGEGGTRVLMAFCRGSGPLTSLLAERGDVGGVDDPAFATLLRDAAAALFPPRTKNQPDAADFPI